MLEIQPIDNAGVSPQAYLQAIAVEILVIPAPVGDHLVHTRQESRTDSDRTMRD